MPHFAPKAPRSVDILHEIDYAFAPMMCIFLKAFGLVFLAEMGDKTQLSTLALAASARGCAYPRLAVFLGSAFALAATSAIAALCGAWISERVPERAVKAASGALFLVFGALFLREAFVAGGGAQ